MAGLLCRSGAARPCVARLLAVVAILAGLALLHAPRCADGMIAEMSGASAADSHSISASTAMSALGSGMASATGAAMSADVDHSGGGALIEYGHLAADAATGAAPHGMGGVLATCLAFLVFALVAVIGLARPSFWWITAPAGATVSSAIRNVLIARSGGLARLCVLRI